MKRVRNSIMKVMEEAKRRWVTFYLPKQGGTDTYYGRGITKAWLGVGTPSYYKDAVAEGYMVPHDKETPRIAGWYILTEKGAELFKELFPEVETE